MSKLSDFGGGITPEKKDSNVVHDTRGERAKHRRQTYRLGRCRAISTSRGCRCGGGVIEGSDNQLCHYHHVEQESPVSKPITIDDQPDILARWCGVRPTEWEEIPEQCRSALTRATDD